MEKHIGIIICVILIVILAILAWYEYTQTNAAMADLTTLGHAYNGIVTTSGTSPSLLPKSNNFNDLNVNASGQVMMDGNTAIL